MPKKPEGFEVPPKLLAQLNECSNGGFVLFNFDDYGVPRLYSTIDNPIFALALQHHIQNWAKSLEAYNVEISVAQLINQNRKKK